MAHIENSQSESGASIWMHHALNDPATPDYVFSHVLKHELLHTRIPPREVDGEWLAHPHEFWEEEDRIAKPDKIRAWEWLCNNFADALKRDNEHECIWVNNKKMKQLLHNRYCAEQDMQHLRAAFKLAPKEGAMLPAAPSAVAAALAFWACPACGGAMVLIERLTPAQAYMRPPPAALAAA